MFRGNYLQDSRGGVFTPRILGGVFTPRILGGVNNANKPPYIRHCLHHQVAKIQGLEKLGLWQRLNSFVKDCKKITEIYLFYLLHPIFDYNNIVRKTIKIMTLLQLHHLDFLRTFLSASNGPPGHCFLQGFFSQTPPKRKDLIQRDFRKQNLMGSLEEMGISGTFGAL